MGVRYQTASSSPRLAPLWTWFQPPLKPYAYPSVEKYAGRMKCVILPVALLPCSCAGPADSSLGDDNAATADTAAPEPRLDPHFVMDDIDPNGWIGQSIESSDLLVMPDFPFLGDFADDRDTEIDMLLGSPSTGNDADAFSGETPLSVRCASLAEDGAAASRFDVAALS